MENMTQLFQIFNKYSQIFKNFIPILVILTLLLVVVFIILFIGIVIKTLTSNGSNSMIFDHFLKKRHSGHHNSKNDCYNDYVFKDFVDQEEKINKNGNFKSKHKNSSYGYDSHHGHRRKRYKDFWHH